MLCWGSWANLQKLTGKWRYELFCWDFSVGIVLAGIVAAFTLGSINTTELTFQDNLLIASYHKISYGLESGALVGLANVFLVAALSVAPMAVVFPIAMGIGVVVGTGWLLFPPQGNLLLLLPGSALVLVAIVMNAFAYGKYVEGQEQAAKKPPAPVARTAAAKPPAPAKGVALSVVSGIVMGMVLPLSEMARSGEDGLGPYAAGLIFAGAALASTCLLMPFFITFAVHGPPVELRAYFMGGKSRHGYGLLAGILWGAGLIAAFASGGAFVKIQAGQVATRGFAYGAAVIGALWGLLGWREFRGASPTVRNLLTVMLILWIAGAGLVVLAPSLTK